MSVPDSVGKCPPGLEARDFGVTEDVLARAKIAAHGAASDAVVEDGSLPLPETVEVGVGGAAPIIAEAGYRQGVEDAKARIQEVKLGPHANREEIETFRAEVDAVLTALTDTEGRDE